MKISELKEGVKVISIEPSARGVLVRATKKEKENFECDFFIKIKSDLGSDTMSMVVDEDALKEWRVDEEQIKTYKMPPQHTSDYGLGLRCGGYEKLGTRYGYTLTGVYLIGLIEFPDNPDFKPQPAPAYVISAYDDVAGKDVFFLADELYIYGIMKPFKTIAQAINHLKSICV